VAEVALCIGVAALSRLCEPDERFCLVLLHAKPVTVQHAEVQHLFDVIEENKA
jgi:hypothetical protein